MSSYASSIYRVYKFFLKYSLFAKDIFMCIDSKFSQIPNVVTSSEASFKTSSPRLRIKALWALDCTSLREVSCLQWGHIFLQDSCRYPLMNHQGLHLNPPQVKVILPCELAQIKLCSCHNLQLILNLELLLLDFWICCVSDLCLIFHWVTFSMFTAPLVEKSINQHTDFTHELINKPTVIDLWTWWMQKLETINWIRNRNKM